MSVSGFTYILLYLLFIDKPSIWLAAPSGDICRMELWFALLTNTHANKPDLGKGGNDETMGENEMSHAMEMIKETGPRPGGCSSACATLGWSLRALTGW